MAVMHDIFDRLNYVKQFTCGILHLLINAVVALTSPTSRQHSSGSQSIVKIECHGKLMRPKPIEMRKKKIASI